MVDVLRIISLCLTPLVLASASAVVLSYGPSAVKRWPKEPSDWLVLGVALGFFGKLLDDTYWCMAWSAYHAGADVEGWTAWGPAVNIFFRQSTLVASAYCHLTAARRQCGRYPVRLLSSALFIGTALHIVSAYIGSRFQLPVPH